MCKYCKFTYIDDQEKTNDCKTIISIRDGNRVSEVLLNRYHTTDHISNVLILDESINLREGLYTVSEKKIEIKYCPFCGEEL